jgi:hypothetical protein
MAARSEGFPLPSALAKWLAPPIGTAVLGVLALIASVVRQRVHHIPLPRMSEEWLLNHQRESHDDV